jgi:hypothetical protein
MSTSTTHSSLMYGWSDAEWLTLKLGPVWVISALLGRNRFDELEQEAFWLVGSLRDCIHGQQTGR